MSPDDDAGPPASGRLSLVSHAKKRSLVRKRRGRASVGWTSLSSSMSNACIDNDDDNDDEVASSRLSHNPSIGSFDEAQLEKLRRESLDSEAMWHSQQELSTPSDNVSAEEVEDQNGVDDTIDIDDDDVARDEIVEEEEHELTHDDTIDNADDHVAVDAGVSCTQSSDALQAPPSHLSDRHSTTSGSSSVSWPTATRQNIVRLCCLYLCIVSFVMVPVVVVLDFYEPRIVDYCTRFMTTFDDDGSVIDAANRAPDDGETNVTLFRAITCSVFVVSIALMTSASLSFHILRLHRTLIAPFNTSVAVELTSSERPSDDVHGRASLSARRFMSSFTFSSRGSSNTAAGAKSKGTYPLRPSRYVLLISFATLVAYFVFCTKALPAVKTPSLEPEPLIVRQVAPLDYGVCRYISSAERQRLMPFCPSSQGYFGTVHPSIHSCSDGDDDDGNENVAHTHMESPFGDTLVKTTVDRIGKVVGGFVSLMEFFEEFGKFTECKELIQGAMCDFMFPRCDAMCQPVLPCVQSCRKSTGLDGSRVCARVLQSKDTRFSKMPGIRSIMPGGSNRHYFDNLNKGAPEVGDFLDDFWGVILGLRDEVNGDATGSCPVDACMLSHGVHERVCQRVRDTDGSYEAAPTIAGTSAAAPQSTLLSDVRARKNGKSVAYWSSCGFDPTLIVPAGEVSPDKVRVSGNITDGHQGTGFGEVRDERVCNWSDPATCAGHVNRLTAHGIGNCTLENHFANVAAQQTTQVDDEETSKYNEAVRVARAMFDDDVATLSTWRTREVAVNMLSLLLIILTPLVDVVAQLHRRVATADNGDGDHHDIKSPIQVFLGPISAATWVHQVPIVMCIVFHLTLGMLCLFVGTYLVGARGQSSEMLQLLMFALAMGSCAMATWVVTSMINDAKSEWQRRQGRSIGIVGNTLSWLSRQIPRAYTFIMTDCAEGGKHFQNRQRAIELVNTVAQFTSMYYASFDSDSKEYLLLVAGVAVTIAFTPLTLLRNISNQTYVIWNAACDVYFIIASLRVQGVSHMTMSQAGGLALPVLCQNLALHDLSVQLFRRWRQRLTLSQQCSLQQRGSLSFGTLDTLELVSVGVADVDVHHDDENNNDKDSDATSGHATFQNDDDDDGDNVDDHNTVVLQNFDRTRDDGYASASITDLKSASSKSLIKMMTVLIIVVVFVCGSSLFAFAYRSVQKQDAYCQRRFGLLWTSMDRHVMFVNGLFSTMECGVDLEDVTHMDLREQQLTWLPPTIREFKHVRTLQLRGNALTALPVELAYMTSLETVDVSHNRLNSRGIPVVVALAWSKLRDDDSGDLAVEVDLSGNAFKQGLDWSWSPTHAREIGVALDLNLIDAKAFLRRYPDFDRAAYDTVAAAAAAEAADVMTTDSAMHNCTAIHGIFDVTYSYASHAQRDITLLGWLGALPQFVVRHFSTGSASALQDEAVGTDATAAAKAAADAKVDSSNVGGVGVTTCLSVQGQQLRDRTHNRFFTSLFPFRHTLSVLDVSHNQLSDALPGFAVFSHMQVLNGRNNRFSNELSRLYVDNVERGDTKLVAIQAAIADPTTHSHVSVGRLYDSRIHNRHSMSLKSMVPTAAQAPPIRIRAEHRSLFHFWDTLTTSVSFSSLQWIDLRDNAFTSISPAVSIGRLFEKDIYLQNNNITRLIWDRNSGGLSLLSKSIARLSSDLTHLDFSHSHILAVDYYPFRVAIGSPFSLPDCVNLQSFICRGCSLLSLWPRTSMKNLTQLHSWIVTQSGTRETRRIASQVWLVASDMLLTAKSLRHLDVGGAQFRMRHRWTLSTHEELRVLNISNTLTTFLPHGPYAPEVAAHVFRDIDWRRLVDLGPDLQVKDTVDIVRGIRAHVETAALDHTPWMVLNHPKRGKSIDLGTELQKLPGVDVGKHVHIRNSSTMIDFSLRFVRFLEAFVDHRNARNSAVDVVRPLRWLTFVNFFGLSYDESRNIPSHAVCPICRPPLRRVSGEVLHDTVSLIQSRRLFGRLLGEHRVADGDDASDRDAAAGPVRTFTEMSYNVMTAAQLPAALQHLEQIGLTTSTPLNLMDVLEPPLSPPAPTAASASPLHASRARGWALMFSHAQFEHFYKTSCAHTAVRVGSHDLSDDFVENIAVCNAQCGGAYSNVVQTLMLNVDNKEDDSVIADPVGDDSNIDDNRVNLPKPKPAFFKFDHNLRSLSLKQRAGRRVHLPRQRGFGIITPASLAASSMPLVSPLPSSPGWSNLRCRYRLRAPVGFVITLRISIRRAVLRGPMMNCFNRRGDNRVDAAIAVFEPDAHPYAGSLSAAERHVVMDIPDADAPSPSPLSSSSSRADQYPWHTERSGGAFRKLYDSSFLACESDCLLMRPSVYRTVLEQRDFRPRSVGEGNDDVDVTDKSVYVSYVRTRSNVALLRLSTRLTNTRALDFEIQYELHRRRPTTIDAAAAAGAVDAAADDDNVVDIDDDYSHEMRFESAFDADTTQHAYAGVAAAAASGRRVPPGAWLAPEHFDAVTSTWSFRNDTETTCTPLAIHTQSTDTAAAAKGKMQDACGGPYPYEGITARVFPDATDEGAMPSVMIGNDETKSVAE